MKNERKFKEIEQSDRHPSKQERKELKMLRDKRKIRTVLIDKPEEKKS